MTVMTNDKHRKACIEAMADAYTFKSMIRESHLVAMTAAFYALHGLARVNPIEATEEMAYTGRAHWYTSQGGLAAIFDVMSAVGDLTKPLYAANDAPKTMLDIEKSILHD